MAIQTIEYLSCSKICCGGFPASVIICLPTTIVATGLHTVEATILAERCYQSNCRQSWIYTISVDDDQLAPNTVLSGAEISGIFCKNCFTDWVEDQNLVGEWQDWVPTIGTSGAMDYTGVTIHAARFIQIGKLVSWFLHISGTIGGVPSTEIRFSPPVVAASDVSMNGGGLVGNPTALGGAQVYGAVAFYVVRRQDASNYAPGLADLQLSGFFEAA